MVIQEVTSCRSADVEQDICMSSWDYAMDLLNVSSGDYKKFDMLEIFTWTEGLSGLYVFLFYTCMYATIAILVFKNEVSEIVSLLLNMYMYV